MDQLDWQSIAPEIARQLLGEPNPKFTKENEWRYGNKGSMAFDLAAGTFYDHELGDGGGVVWLMQHLGADKDQLLKPYQTDRASHSSLNGASPPINAPVPDVRSFSVEELRELWSQAVIKVKYSDDFMVMRFDNHWIKQKYAPFSLNADGSWSMRRPDHLLPLYITNNHPDMPVIVNEGEKALLGCQKIWSGDSATWHGGATGWEKTDWSPIFNREVVIFPDNDDAGLKAASEINNYLITKGCESRIVSPPKTWADKDDLWDAAQAGYFADSRELEDYIRKTPEPKIPGSLNFKRADRLLKEVTNPDWLIKNMIEAECLTQIYGAPKSGKSFIAIAMSCAIASGQSFYGNEAFKKPVLYICGEGQRGVKRRLKAWQQAQYSLEEVPLYLSDRAVRIGDQDDFEKLKQEIDKFKALEGDIGMVVVDTFQRNFGGSGNENSAEDVGNFINKLDMLVAEYKCNICIVHHSGHQGGRSRGSSVIQASLDYEFSVERHDKGDDMFVSFNQTLNKDGQGMPEMKFKFREVELIGEGLELTSGFLELTDVEFKKKAKIPYKQKLVLEALEREALFVDKDKPEDQWFMPSALAGKVKDSYSNDIPLGSIKKLLKALLEGEHVSHDKDLGWQSMEYKTVVKFSDNFEQGSSSEVQ